jgi:hypothetical protein
LSTRGRVRIQSANVPESSTGIRHFRDGKSDTAI